MRGGAISINVNNIMRYCVCAVTDDDGPKKARCSCAGTCGVYILLYIIIAIHRYDPYGYNILRRYVVGRLRTSMHMWSRQ